MPNQQNQKKHVHGPRKKKFICGYFQGKTWTKLMSSEKKREDEEGKKNIHLGYQWMLPG